jgi:hypothetical protein
MESGRNYLRFCPITQLDMSIARIRVFKRERCRLRGPRGRLELDQRRQTNKTPDVAAVNTDGLWW